MQKALREILIGVTIALLSAVITWAVTHIPKGNQFVRLRAWEEVLSKATQVIEAADGPNTELWMAVDVPAYGTIAEPETYRKYKAALAKVQANNVPTQNVLWFSHPFEKAYAQAVEQMKDNDIKKALAESDAIRGFLPSAIVADFPVLAFHNFWISRDSSGRHHVVSCWFTVEPNGRSLMQGLYSTSDDLADLMKQVWFAWKEQSAKGYMSRFLSIPVSAIEEK